MATDLGKVGMRMRGDWSSSATYEVLDTVGYNGATYIAKQAVPANTLPTNTTYWQAAINNATVAETVDLSTIGATTTGSLIIRKSGNVVSIFFYTINASAVETLSAAIPEAFRPAVDYRAILYKTSGGMDFSNVIIYKTGNLSFGNMTTGVNYFGTVTYVI